MTVIDPYSYNSIQKHAPNEISHIQDTAHSRVNSGLRSISPKSNHIRNLPNSSPFSYKSLQNKAKQRLRNIQTKHRPRSSTPLSGGTRRRRNRRRTMRRRTMRKM